MRTTDLQIVQLVKYS